MAKKLTLLLLSLTMVISLTVVPIAHADSFTISGTLEETSTAKNPYEANYMLATPNGYYYLKLEKEFYQDWVGKTVYFNVVGDYYNFAAYSSGLGARPNTLPTTGPTIYLLALASLLTGAGLFIFKRKNSTI